MKPSKKAAVYFSAGIGDALLLTPLIKKLQEDGYFVTGIFTSPFDVESLYQSIHILDDIIVVKNLAEKLLFIFKKINSKFDISFINFIAANKTNLYMAVSTSGLVVTNNKTTNLFFANSRIRYINPKHDLHEAEQNVSLYMDNQNVQESDFFLELNNPATDLYTSDKKTIAVQFGTGNNKTPYKTWDSDRWESIIDRIKQDFPAINIFFLGDKNEKILYKDHKEDQIYNLCGKTTLNELPYILKKCCCFIGGDSGLMHLSAALNIPTFTIWGGSNELMFGYRAFNDEKHEYMLNTSINCRPCNSWIDPNTSRVTDPLSCPDFMCLKSLSVEAVYERLSVFLKKQLRDDQKNS